jgi:hypothetical protein
VHKNIVMPYNEHHQVQFRVEAFNVLNHPNFGGPQANILAGAAFPGAPPNAPHQGFGAINTLAGLAFNGNGTPSIPMRQLQFGLKYTF